LVVSLGLSVRFYLEHLKLLLIPRLASILVIVLLLMAMVGVVSYILGIAVGLSVSLFPMVVLTMIIERMSIVWEERGVAEAIQQGLGSLFVAALAYLVMNIAMLVHYRDFVIKPVHGSGGDGIVVITGRSRVRYRTASGILFDQEQLAHHVSNTLSGVYSLGGLPDKVLIEYRVRFDPVFEEISYQGVPDISIIVFLGIPVMAMVRLPTRRSGGKANLHQGAIGAGIDIATGRTVAAVSGNEPVTEHPDTGNSVTGIEVPHWDRLLQIAAMSYELTGLGYQGIDLVLDKDLGPLILELNARPGLNIQIANGVGLLKRLEQAKTEQGSLLDVEARIAFAKLNFGHKVTEKFQSIRSLLDNS
jgi:alpha-L-glutamate ligase-like protein